jgi:hypothetical protein
MGIIWWSAYPGWLNIYVAFQLKSLKADVGQIRDTVNKIKGEFKHA